MKKPISDIACTPAVKAVQERLGSRQAYAGKESRGGWSGTITDDLAGFIAERDSFYLAPATADGAHESPISREHPYYVLAEAEGEDPEADEERFQNLLEQHGQLSDPRLSRPDGQQRRRDGEHPPHVPHVARVPRGQR